MNPDIKKILVPIDFSKSADVALHHAGELARQLNAEIVLLHSLYDGEYHFDIPSPSLRITNRDEIEQIVQAKLNEIAEHAKNHYSIEVKPVLLHGKPTQKIIDWAKVDDVDLIVMGTHGASGLQEFFAGSNANKVAHLSPVPVITARADRKPAGIKSIVLPIDRYLHSREKVMSAIALAAATGASIHILGLLDTHRDHAEEKFRAIIAQVKHAAEKAGVSFSVNTIESENVAAETMKFGEQVKADLLVMMTDHESEIGTGLFGAFTGHMINHSRIPVMSMNPHYYKFTVNDASASGQ